MRCALSWLLQSALSWLLQSQSWCLLRQLLKAYAFATSPQRHSPAEPQHACVAFSGNERQYILEPNLPMLAHLVPLIHSTYTQPQHSVPPS